MSRDDMNDVRNIINGFGVLAGLGVDNHYSATTKIGNEGITYSTNCDRSGHPNDLTVFWQEFVYAANRLHDSIAIFKVGPTGSLSLLDEVSTRGDYPRSFTIDPSGRFLVSCNQRSDALVTYRITGSKLVFTDQYAPIGNPANIVFLS